MAVSKVSEHWIKNGAITYQLNYFDKPDYLLVTLLAGSVVMAYRQGLIDYDAAHNFRTWTLSAANTYLETKEAVNVYARCPRSESESTALIIYDTNYRDLDGRVFTTKEVDVTNTDGEVVGTRIEETYTTAEDSEYYYVYLGRISSSLNKNGANQNRTWEVDFRFGTLATDQFIMESASDEWTKMFQLNSVTDFIEVLKTIAAATINALTIGKSLVFGDTTITQIIKSTDKTPSDEEADNTLATVGYQKKQIEALDDKYLSKQNPDTANGKITFKDGLQTDNFSKGLYTGSGGGMDAKGNAEVESLVVRTALTVMELLINRQTAIEGDHIYAESDSIESVTDLGDNCYGLQLRSLYDGYVTAQVQNNVLRGIVNTLGRGDYADMKYYTSWMRVNSVNTATNYIEVTLYADEDVPAGKNYPPCALMNIVRYGNQTDIDRQKAFYISSTEGYIQLLKGVTKPIVDKNNRVLQIGGVPEEYKDHILVDPTLDYFYAAGIIYNHAIQIDYEGEIVPKYVDRGEWGADAMYYCKALNENNEYETSDVWYLGCKWRCQKTGTTVAPAWNNTDWAMIEGNPAFTVDFEEPDQLYDIDNFRMPLTLVAKLYNQDVTEAILDVDIGWTRYSEDADGNPRADSDLIWSQKRGGAGRSIVILYEDLDADTVSGFPSLVRFTCTATLRDGTSTVLATGSVSREGV